MTRIHLERPVARRCFGRGHLVVVICIGIGTYLADLSSSPRCSGRCPGRPGDDGGEAVWHRKSRGSRPADLLRARMRPYRLRLQWPLASFQMFIIVIHVRTRNGQILDHHGNPQAAISRRRARLPFSEGAGDDFQQNLREGPVFHHDDGLVWIVVTSTVRASRPSTWAL